MTIAPVNDPPDAVGDTAFTQESTPVQVPVLANDTDPDGDNLTITGLSDGSFGTVTISPGGNPVYTPILFYNGTDTFTYEITDGNGGTDTATVTVTIGAVNDPPNAVDDATTTSEDTPVEVLVRGNDTDPENDPLTVTGTTDGSNGTVSINGAGNPVYTPDPDFNGTDTFTYTIDDGNGASDTATVTVTIGSVNDLPAAVDDATTTSEDTPVEVLVRGNDSDPDNDPLTVTGTTDGTNGTVSINGAGNPVYTPDPDFNGTDTFTYTIDDGNGGTDTASVTVTIVAVDDAPNAVDDVSTTSEETPVEVFVRANDTDPENDPLTVTGTTDGSHGTVSINGAGNPVYTPNPDFNGTDTFTYTIDDGNGGTDTASVTVTISPVNDPPTAVDDAFGGTEDTPITFTAADLIDPNDSDPDGDPLTIVSVDTPINGSVVLNPDASVTFTPDPNHNGLAFFNYTISDGSETDTATVSLTIAAVNDAPTGTDDGPHVTFEDAPLNNLNVLGNDTDPENDPLSIQGIPTAPNGTVTLNPDNTINYTPDPNYFGTDTVTYIVSDPSGATDTVTVTIDVLPVNDPPVAVDDAKITDESTPVVVDLLGGSDSNGNLPDNDPVEGDPLTVTRIDDQPVSGPVTIASGAVVTLNPDGTVLYVPNGVFEALDETETAIDTFTYQIDDGNGDTDIATVTITLNGSNDPPVAQSDYETLTLIEPRTIDVLPNDSDVDGMLDPTTIDLDPSTPGIQSTLNLPGEGVWTSDGTGLVTFTPDPGLATQPSPITYTIQDDDGAVSNEATIQFEFATVDIWFGNDNSGSVNTADFDQSRSLISGTADLVDFGQTIGANAALFSWGATGQNNLDIPLTDNKTQFVNDSANYTRTFNGSTDIGNAIEYGVGLITNPANGARTDVPQVLVILTDATPNQITSDGSLLADAQAAKDAGIKLVIVAIQEAQQDPTALGILTQAASLDSDGNPLIVTAEFYADIDSADMQALIESIALAASNLPPVVIDMDGDGVEFDSIEEGIAFDADGDGTKEQTAWADEDDAVLVYDANGNHLVDGRHEVAFADYSENPHATDLEGLAERFDSNGDGLLSREDEEWESFKLWQDRDGDGEVDDGEMTSLDEAGIASIGLVSDGESYATAGGDVRVHGESEVVFQDGTTSIAADAAFEFDELVDAPAAQSDLEIVTTEGEVVNLDESPTEAPLAPEIPLEISEGPAVASPSMDDEAAQVAAESGF